MTQDTMQQATDRHWQCEDVELGEPGVNDPSPQEIQDACRRIRDTWSERTHRRRAVQPAVPWSLPRTRIQRHPQE